MQDSWQQRFLICQVWNGLRAITRQPVGCFIGVDGEIDGEGIFFNRTRIIDQAVEIAIRQIGGSYRVKSEFREEISKIKGKFSPEQKYLRGIFAGGTFCYQAQQILKSSGINIHSNSPIDQAYKLSHPDKSIENSIVDMGDEYYMVGRPHPMINGSQRALRIIKEAFDPQVAIILLDFILGYNASMDPAGELLDAIQEAGKIAEKHGRRLDFVASVCGTLEDPQDMAMQISMLKDYGVTIFDSNALVVNYCIGLLNEVNYG